MFSFQFRLMEQQPKQQSIQANQEQLDLQINEKQNIDQQKDKSQEQSINIEIEIPEEKKQIQTTKQPKFQLSDQQQQNEHINIFSNLDSKQDTKLFCSWDIYMTKRVDKHSKFIGEIEKITTFDTVQRFLQIYMHMRLPSQMQQQTTVYFIKKDEKRSNNIPSWENHPQGSTIQFTVPINRNYKGEQLVDEIFENTLFNLVGESLQEPIVAGFSIAVKYDIATFTIWIFDSFTQKRTYSRLQLKISNIFHCKAVELKFTTNVDSIKNKRQMKQQDDQNRQRRNNNRHQIDFDKERPKQQNQNNKKQQQQQQQTKQEQKKGDFEIVVIDKKYPSQNKRKQQKKSINIDCSKL